MIRHSISRRTVLRGLGAAVALPFLEAMAPEPIARVIGSAAEAAVGKPPTRMAFIFMPNGMNMFQCKPPEIGANYTLPPTLAPLEALRKQISVLSGLTLDGARSKGDGGGDHARSAAAFLTGMHPYKTAGKNIHLGVSVDQMAARSVGIQTRLPSLELGLDRGQIAGQCDSGYSCAYVTNISWASATQPMPKEFDPASLFDRLFKTGDADEDAAGRAKRVTLKKSILDYIADDTQRLNAQLGRSDQQKLDEYTTAIREIEKRIEAARNAPPEPVPTMQKPDGIPHDFAEHMRLMCDLMVLAFRTDSTRIGTLMVGRDGSDRVYKALGLKEGHHTISHHGGDRDKLDELQKIDTYHMQQIAYFLEKLKATPEGNGTLLDNCMILAGCGIADGNRHNHENLPLILAGGGGGALHPGRHVRYPTNTPLCNLYLSMLDAMGVKADRFGDSTGRLGDVIG